MWKKIKKAAKWAWKNKETIVSVATTVASLIK